MHYGRIAMPRIPRKRDGLRISAAEHRDFVRSVMFQVRAFGDTDWPMNLSILEFWPYLLAVLLAGAAAGWLFGGMHGRHRITQANDSWLSKYDAATRQRDTFHAETLKLRTQIEAQQAVVHKHEMNVTRLQTELESARERIKMISKEQFTMGAERDELRSQLNNSANALNHVKRQATDLENEFVKTGVFYKGELEKSFEKRKTLESKFEGAQAEHESLTNLLDAARSENISLNKMLSAAQARLDNIDSMEQKVIELEAENAQLRHDGATTQLTIDALLRDVAELDELKIQNKELAHCLRSMENSRRQYEHDAKRYREQADQSEKKSETLRMKLDNVEESFAEMARQQDEAMALVRQQEAQQDSQQSKTNDDGGKTEVDDLKEIVGIGKVFEETLHSLGIVSFRQVASFGPSDIARVNMELKEFRGRMEQDDWIGQAKELLFNKYGETH